MASNEITITNDMMLHSILNLFYDLADQEIGSIQVDAETIDGKRQFNIQIIGDYVPDDSEAMHVKTGDKISVGLSHQEDGK